MNGVMKIGRAARKEVLAAFVHYMWADWAKVMLTNCTPKNIEAWRLNALSRYKDLPEKDKEFCRIWANQVLNLMEGIVSDPAFRIQEEELEVKIENSRKKIGKVFFS